jgi:hypothetical protein
VGGSTKNSRDSKLEGVDKRRLELYKSGMCGSLAREQLVSETRKGKNHGVTVAAAPAAESIAEPRARAWQFP